METDGTQKKNVTKEWEDIVLRPSIDIIPDEFERDGNEGFLVEIVSESEYEEANDFSNYLKELRFEVSNTDLNEIDMVTSVNLVWLQNIRDKIDKGDYQGILVVFAKVSYTSKEITNIWKEFTTKKCPKLKNKPKIFIFQILPKTRVQRDSGVPVNWKSFYDTPSEADVLVIQDQYDEQRKGVLSQLCNAIEQYGDKEDIFTLTTINQSDITYQPMLISTMTRKFYFKPQPHRGHHLDIHKNMQIIKEEVDKLHNGREPRKKSGINKIFSFRKSTEKKREKASISSSKTVADSSNRSCTGRKSNASDKDLTKPRWR